MINIIHRYSLKKILKKDIINILKNYDEYNDDNNVLLLDQRLEEEHDFDKIKNKLDIIMNKGFDLILLTNFYDNCCKLQKYTDIKLENFTIYKTKNPKGFSSLITNIGKLKKITEQMEDKDIFSETLENLVYSNKLKTCFLWPQVFAYPLNIIKEKEYLYNLCRSNIMESYNYSHKLSFIWFLLTFIIVSIFFYLIRSKIPKDKFYRIVENQNIFL